MIPIIHGYLNETARIYYIVATSRVVVVLQPTRIYRYSYEQTLSLSLSLFPRLVYYSIRLYKPVRTYVRNPRTRISTGISTSISQFSPIFCNLLSQSVLIILHQRLSAGNIHTANTHVQTLKPGRIFPDKFSNPAKQFPDNLSMC